MQSVAEQQQDEQRSTSVLLKNVIVIADYAFVNGGSAQVSLSSAVALARAGIATTLFTATGPVAPQLHNVDNLTTVCLEQPDFLGDSSTARGAIRGLWNFAAASELRKVLAMADPRSTIVHLHSWTKALSSSVAQLARNRGFEVVITVHDYFSFCPNGSLYDHEKQAPCMLKPMSTACVGANCDPRSRSQKLYRVARQLLADRVAGIPQGVRYFICVSPFSREVAERHLGSARIFDVANPIEASEDAATDPGANDEFVYVGRLSQEKGTDLLAAATNLTGLKTVFVGDGPLGATMREVAPAAEFTGWLSRPGVRSRLRKARALVLPSRWYEASPLVVPEASSMGIPSIVADGCAASRSISNDISGLTFKSGDPSDLARAMKKMATPGVASRLGRAAYEHFWANPPTMERHVSAIRAVYETILAERAS